jgi:hypothetical protein
MLRSRVHRRAVSLDDAAKKRQRGSSNLRRRYGRDDANGFSEGSVITGR